MVDGWKGGNKECMEMKDERIRGKGKDNKKDGKMEGKKGCSKDGIEEEPKEDVDKGRTMS